MCQDTRLGSQVCGLARSVVCHHALKNLAGEKAFETADDLPFGPPFSGASFDVLRVGEWYRIRTMTARWSAALAWR